MPQPETLQGPRATQRSVHLLSDIGNAVRFVSDHGEKVRFVGDWGCWNVYDGKRWRRSPGAESVLELAKTTVKAMLSDAVADYKVASDRFAEAVGEEEEAKAKIEQKAALSAIMHAKKSHGVKQLRDMLFAARSDPKVFIPVGGDVFDIRHHLLNVPNGTVDLRTGKLRPHDWRDYQTALCPTRYNPNATAPTWDRFLRDIFPGAPDVADYVRDLVGYMLTGDTTDQALYLLVGGGSNGKSVLLELLPHVLGDDFTYVTPVEVLMDASGNRHPTEKAGFRGARLAISSETQEEGALNESRIKSLTGSDRITARYCNRDFFSFPPTHKLFIATNHRPRIRGTDNGTWRRVRLIEFPRRFWSDADKLREPGGTFDPKDKADPLLIGKLKAEAEGVLAEGVRRAAKFYATGCTIKPPKPVMVATADYRKAEDNLGQFFDSRIMATADENTPKADLRDCETMTGQQLREEYVNWNRENGNTDSTLIGTRNFGERAKARFRYSRPCGVVNYFCALKSGGLGPKVEGEPPPDGYDPM